MDTMLYFLVYINFGDRDYSYLNCLNVIVGGRVWRLDGPELSWSLWSEDTGVEDDSINVHPQEQCGGGGSQQPVVRCEYSTVNYSSTIKVFVPKCLKTEHFQSTCNGKKNLKASCKLKPK